MLMMLIDDNGAAADDDRDGDDDHDIYMTSLAVPAATVVVASPFFHQCHGCCYHPFPDLHSLSVVTTRASSSLAGSEREFSSETRSAVLAGDCRHLVLCLEVAIITRQWWLQRKLPS